MQAIAVLLVAYFAFDVHVYGSWAALIFFILLGTLTFLSIGFIIASLAAAPESAGPIAGLVSFPMIFVGGIFFPHPEFAGHPAAAGRGDTHRSPDPRASGHHERRAPGWRICGCRRRALSAWLVVSFLVAAKTFRWDVESGGWTRDDSRHRHRSGGTGADSPVRGGAAGASAFKRKGEGLSAAVGRTDPGISRRPVCGQGGGVQGGGHGDRQAGFKTSKSYPTKGAVRRSASARRAGPPWAGGRRCASIFPSPIRTTMRRRWSWRSGSDRLRVCQPCLHIPRGRGHTYVSPLGGTCVYLATGEEMSDLDGCAIERIGIPGGVDGKRRKGGGPVADGPASPIREMPSFSPEPATTAETGLWRPAIWPPAGWRVTVWLAGPEEKLGLRCSRLLPGLPQPGNSRRPGCGGATGGTFAPDRGSGCDRRRFARHRYPGRGASPGAGADPPGQRKPPGRRCRRRCAQRRRHGHGSPAAGGDPRRLDGDLCLSKWCHYLRPAAEQLRRSDCRRHRHSPVGGGTPSPRGPRQRSLLVEGMAASPLPLVPQGDVRTSAGGRRLRGMLGAAVLAGMAGLRIGAGLSTVAVPAGQEPILAAKVTDALVWGWPDDGEGRFAGDSARVLSERVDRFTAAAVGPGLGRFPGEGTWLRGVLETLPCPVVLDADGLNILAEHPDALRFRKGETILTPHPGEMARLAGTIRPGWSRPGTFSPGSGRRRRGAWWC